MRIVATIVWCSYRIVKNIVVHNEIVIVVESAIFASKLAQSVPLLDRWFVGNYTIQVDQVKIRSTSLASAYRIYYSIRFDFLSLLQIRLGLVLLNVFPVLPWIRFMISNVEILYKLVSAANRHTVNKERQRDRPYPHPWNLHSMRCSLVTSIRLETSFPYASSPHLWLWNLQNRSTYLPPVEDMLHCLMGKHWIWRWGIPVKVQEAESSKDLQISSQKQKGICCVMAELGQIPKSRSLRSRIGHLCLSSTFAFDQYNFDKGRDLDSSRGAQTVGRNKFNCSVPPKLAEAATVQRIS
jgi:hypothetical protein